MGRRRNPLHQLEPEQALAVEPRAHVALSASAGTGKTQVLTARVLRLLLSGVRPQTILCLTFTKAAAAEMANRIGARLAAWVRMPDSELKKDLFAIGENNDPETVARARRLFARVLDAPGGLRIQTIHSFAQTLLAAFPAEAGIAPGIQPLEGRAEEELIRRTLADLLAGAEAGGEDGLIGDVQCLSMRLGEAGALDYLRECAAHLEALDSLPADDEVEAELRRRFDLPEGSVDDFLAEHCGDDRFECDLLRAIASANRSWGSETGKPQADKVERWLALDGAGRSATLPDLASVVFTGKGELRKVKSGQIKAEPAYEDYVQRLAQSVGELLRVQRCCRYVADAAAGLRAGRAFARAYATAKRAAGVADFDDLIAWTRALLTREGMADWVRFKLDRHIDHVLVDEAQDTNADQWTIVQALAEEFFTGSSEADDRFRTLLMVGDFKQAIYRFQGTDPRQFEAARALFRSKASALRQAEDDAEAERRALEFRDLSISSSFRSAQRVLDVVDAVIGDVGHQAMGLGEPPQRHSAFAGNSDLAGSVELWPPFALAEADEEDESEEGWLDERDRQYATTLAARIRAWLIDPPVLASTRKPMTAGDILVLVRSRGELASLIVARLFAAGVPVAGIDRLHLQEPFAVKDLLAAATFAVQPLDDLNLANLLVSPLIGWSQDQILDLAAGRKSGLWEELRRRSAEQPHFGSADATLRSLLAMADYATPFRFLETILSGPIDGRRKLYSRLALAARDPIDELLSSALEFERNEAPSLERFLAWFNRGDVEIKREAESGSNAVRVMTVHGAKGLEAPLVILADATSDPKKLGQKNRPVDIPLGSGLAPVIRPRQQERPTELADLLARDAQLELEEHWRLLYVAMTRAKERLVVAGKSPSGELSDDCWHARVARAMTTVGAETISDVELGPILRFGDAPGKRAPRLAPAKAAPAATVPEWALAPAPPESRPPRPLAPSAAAADRTAAIAPAAGQQAAARRGTIIHQLLERLPEVDVAARSAAATAYLDRNASGLGRTEIEEIAEGVCAIIADPQFAPLFGPGSIAEAPLAATLADGRVIAGTVDRLLVEEDRVTVVDYKTGRVPGGLADIPAEHRAQMKTYVEALSVIFPSHQVRSALLYTGGPTIFELGG